MIHVIKGHLNVRLGSLFICPAIFLPALPAVLPSQCSDPLELIHTQGLQSAPLIFEHVRDREEAVCDVF